MDEVERNIRSLPDEELIQMVRVDFEEYTDEALFIARDEMQKREISGEDESADAEEQSPCDAPFEMGTVESILRGELKYQECYDAILYFVTSMNIRAGEYEGANTVIKKMDRENFFLFSEDITQEAGRVILGCVAVRKADLVGWIEKIGEESGFEEEETEE